MYAKAWHVGWVRGRRAAWATRGSACRRPRIKRERVESASHWRASAIGEGDSRGPAAKLQGYQGGEPFPTTTKPLSPTAPLAFAIPPPRAGVRTGLGSRVLSEPPTLPARSVPSPQQAEAASSAFAALPARLAAGTLQVARHAMGSIDWQFDHQDVLENER